MYILQMFYVLCTLGVAYTSECAKCNAGTFSKTGSSVCTDCPENTYSDKGAEECIGCDPVSQYSGNFTLSCLLISIRSSRFSNYFTGIHHRITF